MARLRNTFIKKTKTDNVVVYEMRGNVYLRTKSSLTRKRVLESTAFEKTRKFAGNMAKASRIGSAIYRELNAAKKKRAHYPKKTGNGTSLLY